MGGLHQVVVVVAVAVLGAAACSQRGGAPEGPRQEEPAATEAVAEPAPPALPAAEPALPPPPPAPPMPPWTPPSSLPPPGTVLNMPPTVLEENRIGGDPRISPDRETKNAIQRAGKERIVSSFKLCVDERGAISEVRMLKSSGFPAYDTRVMQEIEQSWAYKPYEVDGTPVPVCTAVSFVYTQR